MRGLCDSKVAADPGFNAVCAKCMEALDASCSEALAAPEFRVAPFDWTPDVKLNRFGSTVQGTAIRSSDLDVRLSFAQFDVRDADRQRFYLRGISKGITSSAGGVGGDLEVTDLIEEATIPLLRLRYKGCLDVDVSMGEDLEGGAALDQSIDALLNCAPTGGPRRFVLMVKAFAKAHGLVDAYRGLLNSMSWVLLAICFLQLERALPPLGVGAQQRDLWVVAITPGMFVRFLAFVDRLGRYPMRVDVSEGCCTRRPRRSHWVALVVDNPLMPEKSVANRLGYAGWQRILDTCAEARALLLQSFASEGPPLQECLERLFLPSDGTWPRLRAPEGLSRAAKRLRFENGMEQSRQEILEEIAGDKEFFRKGRRANMNLAGDAKAEDGAEVDAETLVNAEEDEVGATAATPEEKEVGHDGDNGAGAGAEICA